MSIRNSRLRDAPRRGWRVCVLPVAAHPLALAFVLTLVMISPVVADAKPLTDMQDAAGGGRIYTVSVDNEGGLDVTSKYSAACWMCGINPNKLDSDMRSKLSNSGSGGRFFDFAQQFQQYYLNPTQAETLGLNAAFMAKILLWGDSWGFWRTGILDRTLYSGAMADLAKVMRGDSIGGGSSITGDDLTFTVPVRYVKGTNAGNELKFTGADGKRYTSRVKMSGDEYLPHYDGILPNVLVVNLHDVTFWNGTTQLSPSDTGITSGGIRVRTPTMTSTNLSIVLGNGEVTPVSTDNTVYNGSYYSALNFSVPFGDLRYFKNGNNRWSTEITVSNASSGLHYEYSNGVLDVYFDDSVKLELDNATNSQNLSPPSSYFTLESQFGVFGSQSVTPPPSNNWPDDGDDDPTPGPPDVPDPPDVHLPEPGDPIIPNPPVYDPDPTGTDYVPYLVRIIHCLQDINTSIYYAVINLENALSEHCLHIRTMMAQCLGDLCDYMFELCQWLAAQLSFDVSAPEYDDSTVVSWLMRIYDRISGLNFKYPSYRPTRRDVDDGFDWWGWLLQTIADIFGENFEAGIEGYMQLLRGVLDKFPFSVPWDFLAVYGLLVAVPATPVFDVTIPAVNGWWSAITYHIDLHPFDHVAGAVRHMVMLLWVVVLIRRTKWMTGIFESGALVVSDFLHNRG